MQTIGDFLKQLRLNEKLNLREAGEKSGLSHSYIRYLEIGERPGSDKPINPTPETLRKLASAYNYPYIDLLEKAGYVEEFSEERKEKSNQITMESFIDLWFDPVLAGLTYKDGQDHFHDYILQDMATIKKKYDHLFEGGDVTPSSFLGAMDRCKNVIQKFNLYNDVGQLTWKINNKEEKLEETLKHPVLSFDNVFLTDQEKEEIHTLIGNYLKKERGE